MRSKGHIFEDIDWLLVGLYAVMALFGWLSIYAATYNEESQAIIDFSSSHGKQLMWIGLGLILILTILFFDQRFFENFSYVIYGLAILALIGVLLFGKEVKGAQSWFVLGPVSFQPSELAKLGTALALSQFMSTRASGMKYFKTRVQALGFIVAPIALIMLQPDVGSTLVFSAFFIVLYRLGLSGWVFILGFTAAFLFVMALYMKTFSWTLLDWEVSGSMSFLIGFTLVAAGVYYWLRKSKGSLAIIGSTYAASILYFLSVDYLFDNILQPHHQNRINELLGIVSDPLGAGYNVHQSKIAIGSGGFSGKGFLQGTQTKFDFVPEQSTDFIFCTVGEEWGFLGSFVLISLFMVLISRIIWTAENQKSMFTRIYGYCVASIFFLHFAINVGMTIGLAPVIGIPLPFFSYGGSSFWSFTVLLFIYIKLDSEKKFVLR